MSRAFLFWYGFSNYTSTKKGKHKAFLFLSNHYADYQHLVLWNDDAGSPAPL